MGGRPQRGIRYLNDEESKAMRKRAKAAGSLKKLALSMGFDPSMLSWIVYRSTTATVEEIEAMGFDPSAPGGTHHGRKAAEEHEPSAPILVRSQPPKPRPDYLRRMREAGVIA